MKPNKDGTGSYLQLTFEILDGPHKGRLLWARLNLDNPNATAVAIAKAELSAICRAVGVLAPKDSVELHDLPLVIHVKCKNAGRHRRGDQRGQGLLAQDRLGRDAARQAGQAVGQRHPAVEALSVPVPNGQVLVGETTMPPDIHPLSEKYPLME
jgi:hypothetical protein